MNEWKLVAFYVPAIVLGTRKSNIMLPINKREVMFYVIQYSDVAIAYFNQSRLYWWFPNITSIFSHVKKNVVSEKKM